MDFIPPRQQGYFEMVSWWDSQDLEGVFITREELGKIVAEHISPLGEIEEVERKNYTIFQTEGEEGPVKVAYHCNSCEYIVVGAPLVENIKLPENVPITGGEGYTISCRKCASLLQRNTFEHS